MNRKLQKLYNEKKMWEDFIALHEVKADSNAMKFANEEIIKCKKAIRKEIKREEDRTKDRRIIKGDWDFYLVKIYCPEWIETMEDAEEWFNDCERIEMIYYPWDCTGQWFTSWHRIFCVNGKWICYHDVAMDV